MQRFEPIELNSVRSLSNGKIVTESQESSATLALLMAIALAVIAALLAVFYRRLSDVAVSLLGLVLTIVWALGIQGLLGPNGFEVIGAPSFLSTVVPVMMIGLCVDYGIQGTTGIGSRRRKERGPPMRQRRRWAPLRCLWVWRHHDHQLHDERLRRDRRVE